MVTGHYFTMVNNGFVIISTDPNMARVSVDEPCHNQSQWLISRPLREALFREIAPCSFSLYQWLLSSDLCCAAWHACLVSVILLTLQLCGLCDPQLRMRHKLWNSTHSDWSRSGMTSKYTQSMSFSNICSKKAYLEPSAGLIRNQDDGCCDECKKILGSKTINLTNKTIK